VRITKQSLVNKQYCFTRNLLDSGYPVRFDSANKRYLHVTQREKERKMKNVLYLYFLSPHSRFDPRFKISKGLHAHTFARVRIRVHLNKSLAYGLHVRLNETLVGKIASEFKRFATRLKPRNCVQRVYRGKERKDYA
jgi:hypothetical protein